MLSPPAVVISRSPRRLRLGTESPTMWCSTNFLRNRLSVSSILMTLGGSAANARSLGAMMVSDGSDARTSSTCALRRYLQKTVESRC